MEQSNLQQNLPTVSKPAAVNFFADIQSFEMGQRMCHLLSSSNLVPSQYQGNIANTMIALEMANRTGASPFMVMQNLYVVHGKPAWSAQFIIAVINACGRFGPLHYDTRGEGDDMRCRAWAIEKATGERLEGPEVSIKMAKMEGWYNKKDKYGNETSKWPSMPEVMLGYRAATFFGRRYAPDILMGMQTEDEVLDVAGPETVAPPAAQPRPKKVNGNKVADPAGRKPGKAGAAALNAMLDEESPASVSEVKVETKPEVIEVKADTPEQASQVADQPVHADQLVQPPAEPEQASLLPPDKAELPVPAAESVQQAAGEDITADFNRAMQDYLHKLDQLESRNQLDSWPERQKTLAADLGGEDTEWYQAVMDYWREKLSTARVSVSKRL